MGKENFYHLIITRFNINYGNVVATKHGADARGEEWLEHRFDIFESYTLPSLKNMANQNFKWLIFFDNQTPEKFKARVAAYESDYLNFLSFYVEKGQDMIDSVKKYIAEYVTTPYVITTRVDNDDMLHVDFAGNIQSAFNFQNSCIVDAPYGLQLNIEEGRCELIESYNQFGPFISLIEKADNPEIVYSRQHKDWQTHKNISLKQKKMWLQLIHQNNLLNSFKKRNSFIVRFTELNNFGFSSLYINTLPKDHFYQNAVHNLFAAFRKTDSFFRRGAGKVLRKFRK